MGNGRCRSLKARGLHPRAWGRGQSRKRGWKEHRTGLLEERGSLEHCEAVGHGQEGLSEH